ncbi:Peptidyl-prolyl cis-trans isomerase fkbp8 [Mactra antiquata]
MLFYRTKNDHIRFYCSVYDNNTGSRIFHKIKTDNCGYKSVYVALTEGQMSSTTDTGQNLPVKEVDVTGDGDAIGNDKPEVNMTLEASKTLDDKPVPVVEDHENISTQEVLADIDSSQQDTKKLEINLTDAQSTQENTENLTDEEKAKSEDEFLDILGNGTLLKKILEVGKGLRPMMGDQIIINVVKEIPELGKKFPAEDITYILGDGDVEQALDLAVALMNIGEVALIISGYKYMYGDLGLEPDIPSQANFKLTVHLKCSNGFLDYSILDFATNFSYAQQKKDRGNFQFRRREYSLALNSYNKAIKIADVASGGNKSSESPEKLQKLLEFRATILCNSSACQFKLESYDSAVKSAYEASQISPTYSKAYCRLGQAQEKLGNINDTIKCYKIALKHDADNSKWIHGELERLTKVNKKTKQTQQEMYSKMFWGSNPPDMKKDAVIKGQDSMFSWFWKMGATVLGAGVVGLAGIGIYKYMNH